MISVVLPVYNVEKYLAKCLESILDQTFSDYEIVIVNDGSTDDSLNVAKEVLAKTDIEYQIINNENGGVSKARNTGLNNARGDEVIFIDADDLVRKDFLETLHSLIDGCDYSFCNYTFVHSSAELNDNADKITVYDKEEMINHFLKRDLYFVVPSMLFKRDFLLRNNLYFNEDVRFSEDQMYIWDVIMKTNKCIYTNRKMYGYYLRENSTMTGSPYTKILKGYEQYVQFTDNLIKEYPERRDKLKLILPRWSLGVLYTSSNILNKDEFMKLYKTVDGKNLLKKIKGIGEIKAYLLALVSAISPNLLYTLLRKLKLNG